MINTLDTGMFNLINIYARASFLDDLLPYFSKTWILWGATFLFFAIFAVWCRKRYGEYIGRLSVVMIMVIVSVIFSTIGCVLIQDATNRPRPYQVLPVVNYYNETSGEWALVGNLPSSKSEKNVFTSSEIVSVNNNSVEKNSIEENIVEESNTSVPPAHTTGTVEKIIPVPSSQKVVIENDTIPSSKHSNNGSSANTSYTTNSKDTLPSSNHMTDSNDSGNSMPSSHAANTMAIALVLALLCNSTSPWIFTVPILVGWSRVYMGMQYPMDIFLGWIWGMFSVVIVWWLCNLCFSFFTKNRNL